MHKGNRADADRCNMGREAAMLGARAEPTKIWGPVLNSKIGPTALEK